MNRGMAADRAPALAKVLTDAERAGWAGDFARARNLLRLGERLASAGHRSALLITADSIRTAWDSYLRGDAGRPTPPPQLPRLRPIPEEFIPPARGDRPPVASPDPVRGTAPRRAPPGAGSRNARVLGVTVVVSLLLMGIGFGARVEAAKLALGASNPRLAAWLLTDVRDGDGYLLRGDARIASGDTAGAVSDYEHAGSSADPETALLAGRRLLRIRGQEDAAAEALLRAYVSGVDRYRWLEIAEALETVGRTDEAARVRAGVGR